MSDKPEPQALDDYEDELGGQEAALAKVLEAFEADEETPADVEDAGELQGDANRDRLVGISIYTDKSTSTPTLNRPIKWHNVVSKLMRRELREEKDGMLLGGFLTKAKRRKADVDARDLVQLDIDTKVEIDEQTGQEKIVSAAPPFEDIRHLIDAFEYVGASSHRHDPLNGVFKYRVTLLPDRQIMPEEYQAVLEALDERLGNILDRDAWQWPQAFYLPSCPPSRKAVAFERHNIGALLPIDEFVVHGRAILSGKSTPAQAPAALPSSNQLVGNVQRPPPPVETMRAMLKFLAARKAFARRKADKKDANGRIIELAWIKAGMALRLAYGDADGFNLWAETHIDTRAVNDAPTQWSSFARTAAPGHVTIGSIIMAAYNLGFDPISLIAAPAPLVLNNVDLSNFIGKAGDIDNGKVLSAVVRDQLLHIHETGNWLRFYEGRGWLAAPPNEEMRAAKVVANLIHAQAAARYKVAPEARATGFLMSHAKRTSLAHNLRAMIDMAKSEEGMTAQLADFDAEPMMIGLQNCVFDLSAWEYSEPTPDCRVSKRMRAAYDPDAKCPRFLKFLRHVQPDPEMRKFLRRFMGYCLTGRVMVQAFVFFYGLGANGKSVFIELMAWLLGDYAHKIPTEMLMQHQRNPQGPSPDIVGLKGVRFAFATETQEGRRLDEARVKELTGGDTLSGRVPYGKAAITFSPTHKLIISGNHRPEITDNSMGMWRRVVLVPFDVTILEADRDPHLSDALQAEASGILNWMLRGFQDYKTNGLAVPNQIKAATAAYRDEQDIIGEWLAENCVTGPGLTTKKADLYYDYREWAKANGHNPFAQTRLTRRLGTRGHPISADRRSILGLTLVNNPFPATPVAGGPSAGGQVPPSGAGSSAAGHVPPSGAGSSAEGHVPPSGAGSGAGTSGGGHATPSAGGSSVAGHAPPSGAGSSTGAALPAANPTLPIGGGRAPP